MSLNLDDYPNFKADLEGRDTSLIPIVKIGGIYISTNSMTYGGEPILPLLTSNPSLKESIDIEKRNYKISNISITINNYPYEGERFSERVEGSLINEPVEVYWISPSTTTFLDEDDSAFKIYQGQVRRYEHDDSSCKITAEDRSQATLHTDLSFPMVYGYVDRSPCKKISKNVLSLDSHVGSSSAIDDIGLIIDESQSVILQDIPLYIYSGNKYYQVLEDSAQDLIQGYDVSTQYYFEELPPTFILPAIYNFSFNIETTDVEAALEDTAQKNLITSNKIQCYSSDFIKQWIVNDSYEYDFNSGGSGYNISPSQPSGDSNIFLFGMLNNLDQGTIGINLDLSNPNNMYWNNAILKIIFPTIEDHDSESEVFSKLSGIIKSNYYGFGGSFQVGFLIYDKDGKQFDEVSASSGTDWEDFEYNLNNEVNLTKFDETINNEYTIEVRAISSLGSQASIAFQTQPEASFKYENYFNVDFDSKDFYANVNGRKSDNPLSPIIIDDILATELGQPNIDFAGTGIMQDYDWQYAFTVDKKINSKKLIEGIASASPYIPRFDNMGNFKFDVIPIGGGTADDTIKEVDVIDFSFSRSKIEDVYTKIVFKYNWDYARGEFNDSVTADISLVGYEDEETELYKHDYYGFTEPYIEDGEEIHPDSTLVIDDDRGKYIRSESGLSSTARDFAEWYLLWSCNQHLKMKVKLPLKYMNLEIGDMVNFDAILGGVNPYGIDYTVTGSVNGQAVFPNFLITSTNKTLEWVEILCTQMHNLDSGVVYDCAGIANGDTVIDDCGVCGGAGSTVGCGCDDYADGDYCDCAGNLVDECGICGGQGAIYGDTGDCCEDDIDECGVCNGDGSTCAGCMDEEAYNYNSDAEYGCDSLEGYVDSTQCCLYVDDYSCRPFMEAGHITGQPTSAIDQVVSFDIVNANTVVGCNNPFVLEEDVVMRLIGKDTYKVANYGSGHWVRFLNSTDGHNITEVKLNLLALPDEEHIEILADEVIAELTGEPNGKKAEFSFTENPDGVDILRLIPLDADGEPDEDGEIEQRLYRVFFVFTITAYDPVNDKNITYKEYVPVDFQYEYCAAIGDVNNDGNYNVLDIVQLANCVLTSSCGDLDYPCAADVNEDGGFNVLDIVQVANCVLAGTCGG